MRLSEPCEAAGAVFSPSPAVRPPRPRDDGFRLEVYTCPRCASRSLRRSQLASLADALLSFACVLPFRCHRCFHRFRRFAPAMRYLNG